MNPKNIPLNLDVSHLHNLVNEIGCNKAEIARTLQISAREFRRYLASQSSSSYKPMPYSVYYTLYVWAAYERFKRNKIAQ